MSRTTAPGSKQMEDLLEDHNAHMASAPSAPLYWRTAGVKPSLDIK